MTSGSCLPATRLMQFFPLRFYLGGSFKIYIFYSSEIMTPFAIDSLSITLTIFYYLKLDKIVFNCRAARQNTDNGQWTEPSLPTQTWSCTEGTLFVGYKNSAIVSTNLHTMKVSLNCIVGSTVYDYWVPSVYRLYTVYVCYTHGGAPLQVVYCLGKGISVS